MKPEFEVFRPLVERGKDEGSVVSKKAHSPVKPDQWKDTPQLKRQYENAKHLCRLGALSYATFTLPSDQEALNIFLEGASMADGAPKIVLKQAPIEHFNSNTGSLLVVVKFHKVQYAHLIDEPITKP